jgi:hypothetical protein
MERSIAAPKHQRLGVGSLLCYQGNRIRLEEATTQLLLDGHAGSRRANHETGLRSTTERESGFLFAKGTAFDKPDLKIQDADTA